MNASELVAFLTAQLKSSGNDNARWEARCLAAHVLGIPVAQLSPISEQSVANDMQSIAESLLQRRMQGEPLQYLLGEWEFMGLPFALAPGVLIPRADTEVLCEQAIRLIHECGYHKVLDLCCGTGCIGISLAKLMGVEVTLADISDACLNLARKNAQKNGVEVRAIKTDLFSALQGERYDLICCNPPYLSDKDMKELQREVQFEPSLALHGGTDGLDFYRRIAAEYRRYLFENGAMLLEIGCTQAESVGAMFDRSDIIFDYAGNPRVILTSY